MNDWSVKQLNTVDKSIQAAYNSDIFENIKIVACTNVTILVKNFFVVILKG